MKKIYAIIRLGICVISIIALQETSWGQCTGTYSTSNNFCDINTLFLHATPLNGTPPFTFLWSTGETTQTITIPHNYGDFFVTITDANGCIAAFNCHVKPNFSVLFYPYNQNACEGQTVNLFVKWFRDSIPGATYLWSTGETTPNIHITDDIVWSVTVTDPSTGCSFIVPPGLFDFHPTPQPEIIAPATLCPGQSATLTVDGGPFGGVYWYPGAVFGNTFVVTQPGTYSVWATSPEAGYCARQDTVTILPGNIPPPVISGPPTLCAGQSASLQLTNSASYASFVWSSGETTPTIVITQPGTYSVTATDVGGCTASGNYSVATNPNAPSVSAAATAASCGLSNGAVNITVNNGTAPFTYNWSNGAVTEDLTDVSPGNYTVTVTEANGCTGTATTNVPNGGTLSATGVVSPNNSCSNPGGSVNLTVSPAGIYSFDWSNGATTEDLAGLSGGSYSVTVTGNAGCSATAIFNVVNTQTSPTANVTTTPASCGQSNGSVSLTISGGLAPFSFTWSNGATTEDLVTVGPGIYEVTVTAANGCTSFASGEVSAGTGTVNIVGNTSPNSSCIANNGLVNITVLPVGTYTFSWSNGAITEDLNNVPAGQYTVTATLGSGCSSTADFTVTSGQNIPSAASTSVAASCGQANGSVNLTVSGGTSPFNYIWSNGIITEDLIDVAAGAYTVTVTGANGCTTVADALVAGSNTVSIAGNTSPNTSCLAGNGAVDLTATPLGAYTFAWSNGAITEDLSNVLGGQYAVTVTSGEGCTSTGNYTVPDNPASPTLATLAAASTCGQANGSIDLTVNGGNSPHIFNWSNGVLVEDLSNVIAGSYAVTVTGSNGCTALANAVVANDILAMSITGSASVNTSCTAANGGVDITPAPAGNYTFNWSNGAATEDLNALSAGTYTVTVTAAGGCTSSANFTVVNDPNLPSAASISTATTCGQSNGSVDLTVGGGTLPYTFAWSNGGLTEDLQGLPPNSYSVTVSDASGCTSTSAATVGASSPAQIAINGPAGACSGAEVSLQATAGFVSYAWSGGQSTTAILINQPGTYAVTATDGSGCTATAAHNFNNVMLAPTIVSSVPACSLTAALDAGAGYAGYLWSTGAVSQAIIVNSPGNYSVTVSDGSGCSGSVSSSIVIPALPQVSISGPTSVCTGDSAVLGIAGSFPQILWSNGATSPTITVSQPNIYAVTVTDTNGCTATSDHPLSVGGSLSPDIVATNGCSGNVTLDAGSGYAAYVWSTGNNGASTVVNTAGNYSVTVSNAAGCSGAATIAVIIPAPPEVAVNGPASGCTGASVLLAADAGFTSYLWSNGQNTAAITVTAPATYTVTATDANGCTAVAEQAFSFFPVPAVAISGPAAICTWSGTILSVGANFAQILWSTGATTPSIPVAQPGTYAVTVTDTNGCTAQTGQSLTVGSSLLPNIVASIPACVGTAALDAGTGFATYQWSTGATSQTIQTVLNGTYIVTVSDGNGCTGTASMPVNMPPLPQVDLNGATSACNASTALLTANTGFSTYSWSTGETSPSITVSLTGAYSVTVTDANGCTAADQTVLTFTTSVQSLVEKFSCFAQDTGITQLLLSSSTGCDSLVITHTALALPPDMLPVTVSNFNGYALSCSGSSDGSATAIVQGGTAPFNFQWSNNVTGPFQSNLAAGAYAVTVTDANGCSDNTSFVLVAPPPIIGSLTQQEVQCFRPGQIVVEGIQGGTGPYLISTLGREVSTDGLEEMVMTDIPPGAYSILITDANGCTTTETVALAVPGGNTLQTSPNTFLVQPGDTVQLQAPAGFPNASISWAPAQGLSCTDCPAPWLIATEAEVYTVVLQGYGDCRVEGVDEIQLRSIDEKTPFYVPNVILPGSADNGVFTIYAGKDLINIRVLRIFTRWGEFVSEINNFPPNGPTGWEGDFQGKPVNPGVFVFYAWLEFADGSSQLVKGDVTVVR